jgi:hypothetical protein
MKNVFTKTLASLALIGALVTQANALTIFDVNAYGDANPGLETYHDGNTPNVFDYKYDAPGENPAQESGEYADLLETSISGFTATVTWAPTGSMFFNNIYLKAGNKYIQWDVSGVDWSTYDGFSVTNDHIKNRPGNAFLGISHVQADGGITTKNVPDSGASAILVGLGLISLAFFRRKVR